MEPHSRERSCTVGDLDDFDVNHRVSFNRPPSEGSSRPRVTGRLKRIREVEYLVGNMRRRGIELVVAFPRHLGGENEDTFGPLPLNYRVDIGRPMTERFVSFD